MRKFVGYFMFAQAALLAIGIFVFIGIKTIWQVPCLLVLGALAVTFYVDLASRFINDD